MKNKKKWASLLTISTSLVLCIISTFGITFAFFGGNASANLSTITLKTGIEIGAAIESSVGSAKVVPGQPVKITATGTVSATTKGNPTEANAVDGVVRAKFNVGNELGEVTIAGNNTDFWTAGNDGYYYLVTAENGTTLRTVSKGTSVQIFGDLTVSKNFTNADSGKSVEASVIFEVIQAGVYDSVTGNLVEMTVANATTASSPLYSSFQAVKYVEAPTQYNVTMTFEHYLPTGANDLRDGTYGITISNMENGTYNESFDDLETPTINFKASSIYLEYIDLPDDYPFIPGYVGVRYRFYTEKGGEKLFTIGIAADSEKTIELTGDVSYYVEIQYYVSKPGPLDE